MNKMSFTIGFTTLMEFSDSKSLTYFAAAQDAQGFPKKPITSVKVATGISSIIWIFARVPQFACLQQLIIHFGSTSNMKTEPQHASSTMGNISRPQTPCVAQQAQPPTQHFSCSTDSRSGWPKNSSLRTVAAHPPVALTPTLPQETIGKPQENKAEQWMIGRC